MLPAVSSGVRQLSPIFAFLLLLLSATPTLAQEDAYFRHITTDDGLNSSSVIALAVDHQGFVWIGTSNGLNRHDGARMLSFYHDPADSTSIPDARVDAVFATSDGHVYVGTQNGAARFDPASRTFRRLPLGYDERVVVHGIAELPSGELLLATWQHGLIRFDPESWTASTGATFSDKPEDPTVRGVALTDDSRSWISRYYGLYRLNLDTGQNEMPSWPEETLATLKDAIIFRMIEYQGQLWMATVEGIWSVELNTGELFKHEAWTNPEQPYARTLFLDSRQTLWAGTHGGLNRYDAESDRFIPYKNAPNRPSSILPGSVHAITQDHSGVMWVSSDEHGVSLLDLNSRNAQHIEARFYPESKMPEGHAWTAAEDANGRIWLGMEQQFGYWSREEGRFHAANSPGLAGTTVTSVLVDSQNRIWAGTSNRGVCRYQPATDTCSTVLGDLTTVYSISEDGPNQLWVGTFTGLIHLNLSTGARTIYRNDETNAQSLDSDMVLDARRDPSGRMWAATESGLNLLDPVSGQFNRILTDHPVFQIESRPDGKFWLVGLDISILDPETGEHSVVGPLPTHTNDGLAKSAVVDEAGDLWVNLTTSIAVLDQAGAIRSVFPVPDGRRSFEFPFTAQTRTRDGMLVMGMEDGMILFHPDHLIQNPFAPVSEFSGATIDGSFISPGDSLSITLRPNNRVLTIEFAAPHFSDHRQTSYEVLLSPLESEWRSVEAPQVSFTSLPPGEYTLDVRATTSNGKSGMTEQPLHIVVEAPWWTSAWFILLVVASGGFVIFSTFRWRMSDLRKQNERLDEKVRNRTRELTQKAGELEVANQTKSRFFSNVSHELRTPLTLIKGYLEEVHNSNSHQDPINHKRIARARGLTDRMDDLVGQLLDLSRADNDRLELKAIPADLCSFTARVVSHFRIAAERKFIDLSFECDADRIPVNFDPIKMDQVVSNLISNAIKFTPNHGSVWVTLSQENSKAVLTVADTGPGIPETEQSRIFERFYQVESELTREHDGLGVGLALSNDLVRLHEGTLAVRSQEGEGAVFSVTLRALEIDHEVVYFRDTPISMRQTDESLLPKSSLSDDRPLLLLVEDNRELRRHVRDILTDLFEIVEASDGTEGWKAVQLRNPDLVLSDVMMPGMSGIDLLREIRSSERFKDLPVVLLTARSDVEAQAEGLEARADDFIGKPFNKRVLRARLLNLARRQDEWSKATDPLATGLQEDQAEFMELARSHVRQNLKEPISVSTLSDATNTSERTLQRRIKEIAGVTAGAFVRMERLEVARTLLERGEVRSVSHAAAETGFGNVSHFSKVFEEQFGINPKTYLD